MLDQCNTRFVTCSPVIDTNAEMLDMQSTDATTTGCNRRARIDMNNSGTRQARTVQSGFKESPIAMCESRDSDEPKSHFASILIFSLYAATWVIAVVIQLRVVIARVGKQQILFQ